MVQSLFKASRKIWGAVKSGVRDFSATGFKVMTGCTIHLASGEKFCKEHMNHRYPALSPDQISKESLKDLNNQHTSQEKFMNTGKEKAVKGSMSFLW